MPSLVEISQKWKVKSEDKTGTDAVKKKKGPLKAAPVSLKVHETCPQYHSIYKFYSF